MLQLLDVQGISYFVQYMLESDQALNTGDAVYDDPHYEVPITKNTFKIDWATVWEQSKWINFTE